MTLSHHVGTRWGLTGKMRGCLATIERLTVDGVSPSYQQLMEALGLANKSSVHRLVHALAERGFIALKPGRARTMVILHDPAEEQMTKYRAVRTVVDGITFASKKEAARYAELKMLEKAGKITSLELQPRFPMVINGVKVCTYVADFGYVDDTGSPVIEDCKGYKTDIYKLKKKLLFAVHGVDILES